MAFPTGVKLVQLEMTATEHCYECVWLQSDVDNILFRINQLVSALTAAFREKDYIAVGYIQSRIGMGYWG